ncbi:FAD-dependent oxidoreductase [Christensenellaceae bacterium OttesenSCG-928-M15]|nr:FAD-dependent oxidoreductase [Christensenellaceae bacterium OttesenSCG-928-M15]
MKRIFSIALCIVMLAAVFAGCANNAQQEPAPSAQPQDVAPPSEAPAVFTPGKYTGEGTGFGGKIVMEVEVDANSIIAVNTLESSETAGISDPAFERVPKAIIESQSVAVDTVAGCTMASSGIIEAAKAALLSAGATQEWLMENKGTAPEVSLDAIDLETEVLVIGAGGAGLTAGVEVLKAGGSLIVIDKMPNYGGNTIVAGSAMNAADPQMQRVKDMNPSELDKIKELLALTPQGEEMERWQQSVAKDIKEYEKNKETYLYDSPDLHKLQTYYGGDYVADPKLIEILCDGAPEAVTFLRDMGAGWQEDISAAIGATWPRSHMPDFSKGAKGANFVVPQYEYVSENGGQILYEHTAEELIVEDGRVLGVKGTTAAGAPFTIKASKGVILATGGFSANVEMRQQYNTHWADLGEGVSTSNPPASTGDGIVMAEKIGANLVGMEWIQLISGGAGSFSASILNTMFVNAQGDRFVREDGRRDEIAGAILEQPGQYMWMISDGHLVDDILGGINISGQPIDDAVDGKTLIKADTIEELAAAIGADPAKLQETIDAFNASVAGEKDPIGRQVFEFPIDKAPFYAGTGSTAVHHTMGGVQINELCQVIDVQGNVMPGLYAAGEVTGGIHGSNRLGGNAIADVITFGRIAGKSASQSK